MAIGSKRFSSKADRGAQESLFRGVIEYRSSLVVTIMVAVYTKNIAHQSTQIKNLKSTF